MCIRDSSETHPSIPTHLTDRLFVTTKTTQKLNSLFYNNNIVVSKNMKRGCYNTYLALQLDRKAILTLNVIYHHFVMN